jgi:hypothetical protein
MAEVLIGQNFKLSLPLDFPGSNVLTYRRLQPVMRPTVRNGPANLNQQLCCDEPNCTDDKVAAPSGPLTLFYDRLALAASRCRGLSSHANCHR